MPSSAEVKIYTEAEVGAPDRQEILRYAGVRRSDAATEALLDECWPKARAVLEYKLVSRVFEDRIEFVATTGTGLDRLIARYSQTSGARAVLTAAIGTERVEALCDRFCADMALAHPERILQPRVSPGYGTIPLTEQGRIFRELEVTKTIGVYLTEGMFMIPEKSVAAMIYYA